jgi:hypothetical protein
MIAVQEARLADARTAATLAVDTDPLTAKQVAAVVLEQLQDGR